ncbi:MAG: hypothetical protein IJ753_02360 [Bacteroidales bacterium]|nr:hypothetical protein [Bacteroidales bacterium]MBQ9194743.1 hypothetical protein [Bacteroidales bacterium]MBQ9701551.1 hypothetical protein [Bacteroidales bacterium]MBR1782346.1 hypothetical protein [Bacteroidales bacterium]
MEEEIKKTSEDGGLHFLEQMNQDQIRHDMMEEGKKDGKNSILSFFRKLFRKKAL